MRNSVTTENLLDLAAFIKRAAEAKEMSQDDILRHVDHDVDGLLNKQDDEFWLPRTAGWSTYTVGLK